MKRSALLVALLAGCARAPASTPSEPSPAPCAARRAPPAPSASVAPDAGGADAETAPPPDPGPPPVLHGGGKKSVKSDHGLVVSVEAEATRAGVRVLEAGGNAVDAAVAVAFALAVTHPSAGNIGGGGFMLVRPKGGPTSAIDFRETAPASLPHDRFQAMVAGDGIGAVSVGVPGSVRGLALAHEKFGKLPFQRLVAPAIELAKKGHHVGSREAQTIAWNWHALEKDPAARAEFGDGQKPKKEKDLLVRRDLAKTLERIAKLGEKGFYEGETAERLVRALDKAGGSMTLSDLAGYRAKLREPLVFRYRGLTLETMPPPSAGGVALLETLGMLERLEAWKKPDASAEELHLFLEASRRAQADKRFDVVDPDALSLEVQKKKLAHWRDAGALLAEHPIDPDHATASSQIHPLYAAAMRELEHTTHFSVIDADGMAVSCTTTLSAGFGAKLVVPGTGIVLNNSVASFASAGENLPVGGRRTTSSMAPTLVTRDGELVLVLGTPGGDTIPSTIAQIFGHVVDHAATLEAAVDAPRLHQSFAPDEVRYERAHPPDKAVLERLKALGHALSKKTIPMGAADDILIADGFAWGYVDPREGGLAAAPRRAP